MSTTLYENERTGIMLTQFFGGAERGLCIQLSGRDGFQQFMLDEVAGLQSQLYSDNFTDDQAICGVGVLLADDCKQVHSRLTTWRRSERRKRGTSEDQQLKDDATAHHSWLYEPADIPEPDLDSSAIDALVEVTRCESTILDYLRAMPDAEVATLTPVLCSHVRELQKITAAAESIPGYPPF